MNILTAGLDKIIDSIGNAGDKLFTSDDERLKRQAELKAQLVDLRKSADSLLKEQLEIAKIEAMGNWWQRGWRPMIGWTGAVSMLYSFVAHPILSVWVELPALQTAELYPIVTGMLGIAGMRSYDKMRMK